MRKIRHYLSAAAVALIATGCSSDEFNGNEGGSSVSPEDGVYLAVDIRMPSANGTRSETDNPVYGNSASNSDFEIGQDYENKVSTARIVLAKEDNSFIAQAEVKGENIEPIKAQNGTYKTTASLSKTTLAAYYGAEGFSRNIHVFVFCNPTTQLVNVLDNATLGNSTWYNEMGTYTNGATTDVIWTEGSFLMGNSKIAERELPTTIDDWNNYNTKATAFNLSGINSAGRPNEVDNYNNNRGNVDVERAAARFDFRDGSEDGLDSEGNKKNDPNYNGIGDCTYEVLLQHDTKKSLVNIVLGRMSLVNMNNKYYFLRRVSGNGLEAGAKLCSPELPWPNGNYVVDAYAAWKSGATSLTNGFAEHFNFPFFNEKGNVDNSTWESKLLSDVINDGTADNNDSWNTDNKYPEYKIWRYSTESTIPAPVENQVNGVSTGVVFKGKMTATEVALASTDKWTKDLAEALNDSENRADRSSETDPILYYYGGKLYVTWDNIRRAALATSVKIEKYDTENNKWIYTVDRANDLYKAVFGNGGFGTITFTYNELDKDGGFMGTGTDVIKDDLDQDVNSGNYKWNEWDASKTTADPKGDADKFKAMKEAVVKANITIYQSSYDKELGGWGYYCYYYYWNRHNDNNQAGIMGPMEFDVVRNNVYKLAVTKISRLGHPRIPENDPDKPNPGTPDEKNDVYITVRCQVLPWVVRVNNIEF